MSHFRNVPDKARWVWQGTEGSGEFLMERWSASWAARARSPCSRTESSAGPALPKQFSLAYVNSKMYSEQRGFAVCRTLFPNWRKKNPKHKTVERLWRENKHVALGAFLKAKDENKMAEQKTVLPLLLCPRGQMDLQN